MQFGLQMAFQSWGYPDGTPDSQVFAEEIRIAEVAAEVGFDALWPVEHHFEDYALCPDNTMLLAHFAARIPKIKLGTGAVIVPWHEPLRIAERIAMLDHLCEGRLLFGMGRGLSRREYEGFGIPMDESRDRFDEGARMVIDALETGFIEGDGPYYPQKRTEIRPRPERSFKDRTYAVGMSPESVDAAADIGARLVIFSQRPAGDQKADYERYCERFTAAHDREPGPMITCDFVYCDKDRKKAEDIAHEHLAGYLHSVMDHYELMSDHFKTAKGYETYGSTVDLMKAVGLETITEHYVEAQAWGTPADCIEKLMARREILGGDYDLNCAFRYAGLPVDLAEQSLRTFAEEVLPVMRSV